MITPTCQEGLINNKLISKIKSSLLIPFQEVFMQTEYRTKSSLGLKPYSSAVKNMNNSKFSFMFFNQKYQNKGKKEVGATMSHNYSSNMMKTYVCIPLNCRKTNMLTSFKAKEIQTNKHLENLKINKNLNNDLYLSNYHINSYISRTDTSRLLIREQIKLRKEHCTQPLLSLAFISKRNKHYHSKTFNDQVQHNKYMITFSKNNKFHNKALKNHHCTEKEYKENIEFENENDLFKVMKIIHRNKRNEMNINKKDLFKKLRGDILKSDYKIKTILDDLRRTQTLNDEGLKRKGFIMKIGCITGEYLK